MIENSAPTPLAALPRVNQSARWNSRIIANGLRSVMVFSWLPVAAGIIAAIFTADRSELPPRSPGAVRPAQRQPAAGRRRAPAPPARRRAPQPPLRLRPLRPRPEKGRAGGGEPRPPAAGRDRLAGKPAGGPGQGPAAGGDPRAPGGGDLRRDRLGQDHPAAQAVPRAGARAARPDRP